MGLPEPVDETIETDGTIIVYNMLARKCVQECIVSRKPLRWFHVCGLFPEDDARMLQVAVTSLRFPEDHVILEIGSFLGRSTAAIAEVAKHKIVSIDPHKGDIQNWKEDKGRAVSMKVPDTYDFFLANMRTLKYIDKIEPIRARAEDVEWNGRPIALLFIDGIHDREHVKHDFEKFYPHVVKGGLIAFHDYSASCYPEVKQYVDYLCDNGNMKRTYPMDEWGFSYSMKIFKKR